MSRLIVKNIPNQISEAELKKIFEKKGEISDVKVIFKGNKNRRFCFIGYKHESDAIKAKDYFDKTFVMMSKISVDFAKTKDDPSLPRAWSRHTQGSSSYQKLHPQEESKIKKVKQQQQQQQQQEQPQNQEKNEKFKEFLDLMKNNQKTNQEISWNDNVGKEVDKIFEKLDQEIPEKEKVNQQIKKIPINVDEKRLYVTNIPYTSTEQELKTIFEKYGTVLSLKIPKQRGGSLSGFCFVQYELPEEALRAFSELDNKIILGRIFHVRPAFKDDKEEQQQQQQQSIQDTVGQEKSSYKKFKKQQMLEKLNDTTSWNTLFLNPNTIIDGISKKYGIDKKDILSEENEDIAVKMAQMETQIIKETKDWLKSIGLNIDFLKVEKNQCERSSITLFVKNIQFRVNESELSELFARYGQVSKVYLAPNRAIGIVTMADEQQAKNAFQNLSNYKFKGSILYLEWAPKTLQGEMTIETQEPQNNEENELTRILYVKNLNFNTTEKDLFKFFSQKAKDIKKTTIINKDGLSQGYGFIEFDKPESAAKALRLNNLILHDHNLQLSQSKPKPKQTINKRKEREEIQPTNKILIKNLPFEANAQELRKLIKQYGELKKLRLPKKLDGTIRGFAFAEFVNIEEAQNAAESLANSHFYGRRLVIEFSKEEE